LSCFIYKFKRCRCGLFVGAVSGANTAFSCCLRAVFFPRIGSLQTTRLGTASDMCTAWMTSCIVTPRDLRPRRFIDPGQAMSGGQVTKPPPAPATCIGFSTSLRENSEGGELHNCV
jgi:hypothetical protein